jgi:hypothetical protein
MRIYFWITIISILIKETVAQAYTVDLVGPLSASAFNCIYHNGYTYAIVRAYSLDKGGSVDRKIV